MPPPSHAAASPFRGGVPPHLAISGPLVAPMAAPAIGPMPLFFVLGILLTSLLLQRFVLPIGSFKFSIETPIGLALGAWGLLVGNLRVDHRRFVLLLGIATTTLIATAVGINLRVPIAPRISLPSCANWLALTAFAALTFRTAVPEESFFRLINLCLAGIALAGVMQFVAQFAGRSLFSFDGYIPPAFMWDTDYFKTALPITYGASVMRANGLFLVEPSVFSQFMAAAIIIEFLYFGRLAFLALFIAGLLVSVSGTGLLMLATLAVQMAIGAGRRGILRAFGLIAGVVVAFIILAVALPNVAETLLSRTTEFSYQGTSGNERFVGPFLALWDVLTAAPWAVLTGIGPGAAEYLNLPYPYAVNAPVKLLMEYGMGGLVLYLALLISAKRTRRQRALLAPMLVWLLVAGNWGQFAPVLFPILLINNIAKLREGAPQA